MSQKLPNMLESTIQKIREMLDANSVVGQPIVGANVPGCMAFVEDYLNAQ